MIDKKLLAKIRKCLALAKSANEHEAAAALAMARRLMDDHDVDADMLELSEIEEAAMRGTRNMRPPQWEGFLVRVVERAIGVVSYIDENLNRRFVGRGPSAEIAAYAFQVLFRQLKRARTEYIASKLRRCKPGRKRQRADIFCFGWASVVYSKIKDLMPERPTDAAVEKWLAEQHPDLVTIDARQPKFSGGGVHGDYWSGRQQGRAVELNQGVSASSGPLALA